MGGRVRGEVRHGWLGEVRGWGEGGILEFLGTSQLSEYFVSRQ